MFKKKEDLPIAVIDVETAQGFDVEYQPICSIAICLIDIDGTIQEPNKFLVKPPDNIISEETTAIHGVTPEMTKDAPDFKTLWHQIAELIQGRILVMHNADFDSGVIETELKKGNIESPKNQYTCTLDLARVAFPNEKRHGLSHLAKFLNIELEHHDPASDALVAAEILKTIMQQEKETNLVRLAKKLKVPVGILGSPPRWPGGFRHYESKPHFKMVDDEWSVAAPLGVLYKGIVITVQNKAGKISVVEIGGSKIVEAKATAGGILGCATSYKDVSENPEYQEYID